MFTNIENLEEINSLKEAIDTLQSSDSLFEDFLSFYHKLTWSSFFLKYNWIKVSLTLSMANK